MIKLQTREMKSLSRILTVCLCCVPAFGANSAPVATTAGSNLTAYNPSNAYNNQWATMTNGRYDGNTTAKVDFGNCNAVVLRCAQPKCNNGGCADASVASAIVAGCVRSNNQCKQYGDELIEYMTAQLVASSNAKMNQQQMALEQAKIQAEAAAASSAQSEQISQMQNQMYQMQQQMAQQQAESAAQLQEALAQQAAQSAAALEDMRSAATDAAKQTEAGITAYQQDAINRGISEEVLARQQITGQIQTEIEDAETSMVAMKKAMQNAFDYAGCDARGNNCTGPRRIKKWRELAIGFLTPYDTTIDKIYDALVTAQTVGVDLTDIYMMLNNSCNSWGQYMCQKGADIEYNGSTPLSCTGITDAIKTQCAQLSGVGAALGNSDSWSHYNECIRTRANCKPCTLLKVLNDKEEVYEGWINPTADSTSNGTVVSCASSILDNTKLFSRRTKNKNGAGLVDIDLLDRWLNQTEPNKVTSTDQPQPNDYCGVTKDSVAENALSSATLSHIVNTNDTIKGNNQKFCVDWEGGKWKSSRNSDECPYINPTFAICDTHPYNAGHDATWATNKEKFKTDDQESMNRIIALKITVVSQQMYKQYEYMNATLRRLKTQLQKAVLTSNLEAAGAKSEGSASGGLVGGKGDEDKTIYLPGANNCSNFMDYDSAYNCLQTNVSLIKTNVNSNTKKACQQLQATVSSAKSILSDDSFGITKTTHACYDFKDVTAESKSCVVGNNKTKIVECANAVNFAVMNEKRNQENRKQRMNTYP